MFSLSVACSYYPLFDWYVLLLFLASCLVNLVFAVPHTLSVCLLSIIILCFLPFVCWLMFLILDFMFFIFFLKKSFIFKCLSLIDLGLLFVNLPLYILYVVCWILSFFVIFFLFLFAFVPVLYCLMFCLVYCWLLLFCFIVYCFLLIV